ncbi:MAG: SUMF1/EgtB/PvdO family nonheme iron enzyme [Fibrobacter sp.]|nr:SUMF1/EgtB/PvdO family nonheme iron enzyme [Fibrobacter sp.]HON09499.1 SUMF1/EgtB/PvdO family nonheme iron enzyme [Chitinispirillaceae bacterium]
MLFLVFRLFRCEPPEISLPEQKEVIQEEPPKEEKAALPDTTADTVVDTVPVDTVPKEKVVPVEKKPLRKEAPPVSLITADTVTEEVKEDSIKDSSVVAVEEEDSRDPCELDTLGLWVYPDPSGGLHRKPVDIRFFANKKGAVIRWRLKGDTAWTVYSGDPVRMSKTGVIVYEGRDTCGRGMETREEFYEIEQASSPSVCPPDMEYIKVGSTRFCIDRYEWPNRKGVMPLSYISFYHAADSCFAAGKRLCTSEEWYLACTGPHGWKYPYGQFYEPYACATHDTIYVASGSRPECRGFFDVYDMSGNLMEWTDTRARENTSFYYVQGGFHQSGQKSGCSDKRYSYYPQNQHNPVGFRCCADVPEAKETGEKKKK